MDSASTVYVKDASGTVEIATTTDDRERIVDALHYSPEEEQMQRAQERQQPTPAAPLSPDERLAEARHLIPNFDRDTFKESAELWEGVLMICRDHPNGLLLANKIATNPKFRRELRELPVHLSMARAGAEADRIRSDGNPHSKEIEWGKR